MTVVVAFLCSDGAVIAADSMVTTSIGGEISGEHTAKKVAALADGRLMGWAGDLDLGLRFQAVMHNHRHDPSWQAAMDHAISISRTAIQHYQQTGLKFPLGITTAVAFEHAGEGQCCIFQNNMQPLMLHPESLFYIALGTGKVAADPFLRFLVDIFCKSKRPTVSEARFLATWAVAYTITSQPGVGEPIRVVTLERDGKGFIAKELGDTEIDEHRQAIRAAEQSMRTWRDSLQKPPPPSEGLPDFPVPPPPPASGR
jgi:20S proteasome alpha/beta subunit